MARSHSSIVMPFRAIQTAETKWTSTILSCFAKFSCRVFHNQRGKELGDVSLKTLHLLRLRFEITCNSLSIDVSQVSRETSFASGPGLLSESRLRSRPGAGATHCCGYCWISWHGSVIFGERFSRESCTNMQCPSTSRDLACRFCIGPLQRQTTGK